MEIVSVLPIFQFSAKNKVKERQRRRERDGERERGGERESLNTEKKHTPLQYSIIISARTELGHHTSVFFTLVLVLDFSVRDAILGRCLPENSPLRQDSSGGGWRGAVCSCTCWAILLSLLIPAGCSPKLPLEDGRSLCPHFENTDSSPHFTDKETKAPTSLTGRRERPEVTE